MNGLLLLALSMVALAAAYVIYGRYLEKTWGIDPKAKTPAVANEDGVDFVPSSKWEVFAHQFSSIAGAGPVTGPVMALMWLGTYSFMDYCWGNFLWCCPRFWSTLCISKIKR